MSLGGFLGEALRVFHFFLSFKCPDPQNGHHFEGPKHPCKIQVHPSEGPADPYGWCR